MNLNTDPRRKCPFCESTRVYGNGTDATEFCCPDCYAQYDPAEIEIEQEIAKDIAISDHIDEQERLGGQ